VRQEVLLVRNLAKLNTELKLQGTKVRARLLFEALLTWNLAWHLLAIHIDCLLIEAYGT
jgi:hypothetical protein